MNKTKLILIFISLYFINACQKRQIDYLEQWKTDKKACNGIRTVEKTQDLLKKLKIETRKLESIMNALGTPDKLTRTNEATYLEYYIENNCSSEEKDVCLLIITYFKDQNKPELSITCT